MTLFIHPSYHPRYGEILLECGYEASFFFSINGSNLLRLTEKGCMVVPLEYLPSFLRLA